MNKRRQRMRFACGACGKPMRRPQNYVGRVEALRCQHCRLDTAALMIDWDKVGCKLLDGNRTVD